MGTSSARKVRGWAWGLALGAAVGWSWLSPGPLRVAQPAWAAVEAEDWALGVVDLDALLEAHPEHERLDQLDQELAVLRQELELLPWSDARAQGDRAQQTMKAELEKGRKELEGEYRRVTRELSSLGASMGARLRREGEALQAQYKARLETEMRKLRPEESPLGQDASQKLKGFLGDLQMVRQQRITAHRLELEKASQARLEAERQRVEAEVASFENALMREHQERKLNIQLKLQVAEDPEQEAALQAELSELGDQEYERKEARRAELFKELEQLRGREKVRLEAELTAYEDRLNREVQQKVVAERSRLAGRATSPAAVPAEVQRKIEQVRGSINTEMAARKAKMEAQMKARQAQAQRRLEKKRAQVEARIQATSRQLKAMVEKAGEEVSAPTRERMDAVEAQLRTVEAAREELHAKMLADLQEKVGQAALKQGVPSVVGRYVVNVGLPDLTDLSVVAIKQTAR